jgi:hypothetical protein
MGKEMRELYIEGVAIHGGPESCVGVREDVGEALTGVRAGWVIEPRKDNPGRGADALTTGGRQHRWRRFREGGLVGGVLPKKVRRPGLLSESDCVVMLPRSCQLPRDAAPGAALGPDSPLAGIAG